MSDILTPTWECQLSKEKLEMTMQQVAVALNENYLRTIKKSSDFSLLVNQLGLEPRTPSLKGMCSTC